MAIVFSQGKADEAFKAALVATKRRETAEARVVQLEERCRGVLAETETLRTERRRLFEAGGDTSKVDRRRNSLEVDLADLTAMVDQAWKDVAAAQADEHEAQVEDARLHLEQEVLDNARVSVRALEVIVRTLREELANEAAALGVEERCRSRLNELTGGFAPTIPDQVFEDISRLAFYLPDGALAAARASLARLEARAKAAAL